MNKKNIFNILLLIISFCCSTMLNADDGKMLLKEAMNRSKNGSFYAKMRPPSAQNAQSAAEWRFARQEDGNELKLELVVYRNMEPNVTYIFDSGKTFAYTSDGRAAEIVEVPELWYPELIYAEIPSAEVAVATYTTSNTKVGTTNYRTVEVKTPSDDNTLMMLTQEDENSFQKRKDFYRKNRVMVRKFLIGSDGLIHQRKHYNADGKIILDIDMRDRGSLDELHSEIFAVPKNVSDKYLVANYFMNKSNKKLKPSSAGKSTWFADFGQSTVDFMLKHGGYCALGLSGVLIAILIMIKFYQRRKIR